MIGFTRTSEELACDGVSLSAIAAAEGTPVYVYSAATIVQRYRDLDAAYQKLDLSASYRIHPRVSLYTSIENILDSKYDASFGFPSLPRAARAGARITLGGD